MPFKTLRYIIIEADTRPLELFLSGFSVVWGCWLTFGSIGVTVTTAQLVEAVSEAGGHFVWAGWALVNGIFQGVSLWKQYPKFRRWAATVSAIYWIFAAYCLLKYDARIFQGYMAAFFGTGQLWVVLHRNAILGAESKETV
jgi:hypothetical protein